MDWQRPLNDIDAVVTRLIETITAIARRVARYAMVLLLAVVLIAVLSFALGIAALSGGIETVWIVLGIVFGSVAIGAAVLGRWRLGAIRKDVPQIATEVKALLSGGRREVIDIIDEFQDEEDASSSQSVVIAGRHVMGLSRLAGHGFSGTEKLTKSVTAITSYPLLALTAVCVAGVFALMIPIFLLALAL